MKIDASNSDKTVLELVKVHHLLGLVAYFFVNFDQFGFWQFNLIIHDFSHECHKTMQGHPLVSNVLEEVVGIVRKNYWLFKVHVHRLKILLNLIFRGNHILLFL
jgi:hypothetical protein